MLAVKFQLRNRGVSMYNMVVSDDSVVDGCDESPMKAVRRNPRPAGRRPPPARR